MFFFTLNLKVLWGLVFKVYFFKVAKDSSSATAPYVEVAIGINGSTVAGIAGNFILIHQIN
jgi:hypothetical protein